MESQVEISDCKETQGYSASYFNRSCLVSITFLKRNRQRITEIDWQRLHTIKILSESEFDILIIVLIGFYAAWMKEEEKLKINSDWLM